MLFFRKSQSEKHSPGGNNLFRYRGYYYDSELGMYYLQSRYYDPVICRFINADSQLNGGLLGYNLYAYCENNPVRYIDPFGTINWDKFVQGALLFTVGALTVAAVIATGGTCAPWVAVGYAVLGASGVVAAGIGASEMVEAFTGSNPMREDLGTGMYNALMMGSVSIISFGPMILEYGNAYGNVCFVEGTLIATENGNIPIEEIEAGMLVYAHDPDTGETALKPVVQTFRNEATELVHITVDGEEIICTNEHPFYSPVKGWTAACQLRAGDILVTVNGEYVVVEKVQHELLESPVTVYNFEVEGFHTYFVGDTEVLVHNSCKHQTSSWRKQKSDYWKANQNTPSDLYDLSDSNMALMSKGKAPIGFDGYRIELHHVNGISNSSIIIPMTKTSHTILHKYIGYFDFVDYIMRR